MPDINLTEQEVQTLLRCLNDRIEPPEELAKKLFPKLYAGFDFKTINRASIPTIEYAGKRSEAAILNEASVFFPPWREEYKTRSCPFHVGK